MPTVTLHARGQIFRDEVKDNTNLVVRAGIRQFPYPNFKYRCGMGKCATCTSLIISGGEHLPAPNWEEKKLLGDRLERGFRLACQLWISHDIELTQEFEPVASTSSEPVKADVGETVGAEETIDEVTNMYVVLTTKPGEFRTEIGAGLKAIESYDYIFYGRKRANFTIAEIADEGKITIVEDEPPQIVNTIPSKLFEHFETVDEARNELETLTHYGSMDIRLKKV